MSNIQIKNANKFVKDQLSQITNKNKHTHFVNIIIKSKDVSIMLFNQTKIIQLKPLYEKRISPS